MRRMIVAAAVNKQVRFQFLHRARATVRTCALAALWLAVPGDVGAASVSNPANWCSQLAPRLPGVSAADCQASNLEPTGAVSHRGFPILSRQISSSLKRSVSASVRVLLLGGIHGDELTSSAIVFKWLQQTNTPLAKEFAWQVVPVLNPDGLLAARPSRVNGHGVDLNRNFPTPNWQREAPRYWI